MYPFLLTTIAGAATMLGTIPIFFKIKNKDHLISSACSFASGVMICVSILDLIPESINYLRNYLKFPMDIFLILLFIIIGIIISISLDKYIDKFTDKGNLYKVGILSMIAIILHNIPEGIVTYIVTSKNIFLGLSICIAIAIHNIPEGISIAIPIYYSTKSKSLALLYTFISAISEPFGAIISYMFLSKYINDLVLGLIFALIAGIMIYISSSKLLPTSINYERRNTIIYFILGFVVMITSLILNSLIS